MDWKDTLNLPQTSFPMKANLVEREPQFLEFWEKEKIYEKMLKKRENAPLYVLHDGPPYANGHIHLGTALNKILKDIIVKSKTMAGYKVPFVPGWDCHGLPIELKTEQELGVKRGELPPLVIREACRKYAERYINIQREEFKRLGVFAFWDKPYLTMDYKYEATIAREFLRFLESGQVYRKKKPVFWCPTCVTALAEAEVEYGPHKSYSIFVKFPFTEDLKEFISKNYGVSLDKPAYVLIWTTTPWTLPANLGLALNPEFDYLLVEWEEEYYLVAEGRVSGLCAELNKDLPKFIAKIDPKTLEGKKAFHPFYQKESLIILADFVSLDTGTGIVHIAPGHGEEDYQVGLKYGLEVYVPVDQEGRFYKEVELVGGLSIYQANEKILETLKENGRLLHVDKIEHNYPFCWRCKKPIIFRAEDQWFISMELKRLREKALKAIESVKFIPSWGKNRLYSMLESRPDWCVSRQRVWGVPITVFKCENCGEILKDFKYYEKVIALFEKEGCDPWFVKTAEELLPEGTTCPKCGHTKFTKEKDILDVWFDSGVSFAAVIEKREELSFPADLYLEGSDQHRGWFHSSLLCAVGTRGVPPYKALLTHGFVVDGQGRKMSKSLGNVIHPQDLIKQHGAEILRLWVSAEDYRDDIKISKEILARLVEAYRKVRNTCRFLIGNLYDFDPKKDLISFENLPSFEKYILYRLSKIIEKVKKGYEDFEFHVVYHEIYRFCVVELSSLIIDINRDYLYCERPDSPKRRATQTVFYYSLDSIVKLIAPILSFTAEDIWQNLPYPKDEPSVFLTEFPNYKFEIPEDEVKKWETLLRLREEFLKALEIARKDHKSINTFLEAEVYVKAPEEIKEYLKDKAFWEYFLMIAKFELVENLNEKLEPQTFVSEEISGLKVLIKPTEYKKCERCWQRKPEVGNLPNPELCERCYQVVGEIK
ncbi:isoleucine--tRNA ligase [Thermodesulfobacterium sp. TA1]|uniref:isoleucine--tRNA ligase n=1 Tax=Thermodesulfobacterium sp. TA1 TaxID=2234087 RepID=UPI001231B21E|nr:isoleucine--tRNA ligase [Thermodesulfobacterium sp. TA1]QER41900.1 isoleucine--tRNA ligase [Thermodesulfobacterium sp. TA1]